MTDNTAGNGPVIVTTSDRRRRLAAMIAVGSLATAGIVGGTMAAFTDSEYAGLNESGGGYAAALWNLQISEDGDSWVDTTAPTSDGTQGAADNTAEDVQAPIDLTIDGADNLIPGDATTYVTTTFQVRNEDTSTQDAQLVSFKLLQDPNTTASPTDADLLDALRFDVSDGTTTVQDQTYADLASGVALSSPTLDPGAVQTYTVRVLLPDQGSATANSALQGMHAYLVAQVNGTSVAE
ncbi:SipW-dependent-type signal peptide-containing protein [Gryllotalpicola ginsengisoli]|uniref:SipW-dependent-type signal peptide-containing protein n=1 Tax=Gryllotalpicola ginsengisoli TaxID=444608 RepID=UPI0003B56FEB|nr:SipW-dependent-type signal peptide-containing protein [Gryllotalpicola ginsengisoli]